MCCQPTYTKKNAKESLPNGKEMTSNRYLDYQEGMKSSRNGKHMVCNETVFTLNFLTLYHSSKQNNTNCAACKICRCN